MCSSEAIESEAPMVVEDPADPGVCPWCGGQVPAHSGAGRPRVWCSDQCRRDAHNARKAARSGAVGMQVVRQTRTVEKPVTKVRFQYVPVRNGRPDTPSAPAADRAVEALRQMHDELLRGRLDPDGYAAVVAEADRLIQTMQSMRDPAPNALVLSASANRQQRRKQAKRRR